MATRLDAWRSERWRAQPPVHFDGGYVRSVRRSGFGPAPRRIVMIHGFEETWRSWLPFCERFPLAEIECLDLPWRSGNDYSWVHGGSSRAWLRRALSSTVAAGDVDLVVAHSFGATTLLELLATNAADTEGISATALVAPIYRPHDASTDPAFFAEALSRTREVLREGLRIELGARAARMPPMLIARMHDRLLSRVDPDGLLALYSAVARTASIQLEAVRTPVLAICGTGDHSAPPPAVAALLRRLPYGSVYQAAHLSHFCHVEQPDSVAAAVSAFLDEQPDPVHPFTPEAISA